MGEFTKMKGSDYIAKRIIEIAYKYKNGHVASALSALPIIKEIYDEMDIEKDVFILSKGHGCLALYAVLESKGYKPDVSKIHPDIDIKNGISCTTGSLGHGLPIAVGMALAKKLKNESGNVSVLLGDGECQEGTTWESLLIAKKLKLNNLQIHIDNNKEQALGKTVLPAVELLHQSFGFLCWIHDTKKEFPHVHYLTKKEYNKL